MSYDKVAVFQILPKLNKPNLKLVYFRHGARVQIFEVFVFAKSLEMFPDAFAVIDREHYTLNIIYLLIQQVILIVKIIQVGANVVDFGGNNVLNLLPFVCCHFQLFDGCFFVDVLRQLLMNKQNPLQHIVLLDEA